MYKVYYVYILTNKQNNVLYTGLTNDIQRRIYEHKHKLIKGFTNKYNVDKLIYYEEFNDVFKAIAKEKQIKAGSRKKKLELVSNKNPYWEDLYNNIIQ